MRLEARRGEKLRPTEFTEYNVYFALGSIPLEQRWNLQNFILRLGGICKSELCGPETINLAGLGGYVFFRRRFTPYIL